MSSFGNSGLKDVGKIGKIDPAHDVGGTVSDYKQNLMRAVDLIPVYYTLDMTDLFDNSITMKTPVELDYGKGIGEYMQKLGSIGLSGALGVRAWVTNESTSQDSIENEYNDNKIVETFNTQIDSVSKMMEWMKSMGATTNATSGSGMNPFAAALIDGRHLSLPKIWKKTDYNTTLTLNVKLTSPYGTVEAIRENIAEPLLYLTTLVCPSSYDGITYGLPPYMTVRAYGVSYMALAYAKSLSVVRGGSDSKVNARKQPLEISVSMDFAPALPGFAAMIQGNDITSIGSVESPASGSDMAGGSIPGIVTPGSIIESLRPVEDSGAAFPPTPLGMGGIPLGGGGVGENGMFSSNNSSGSVLPGSQDTLAGIDNPFSGSESTFTFNNLGDILGDAVNNFVGDVVGQAANSVNNAISDAADGIMDAFNI